jgi:hypothetical protein
MLMLQCHSLLASICSHPGASSELANLPLPYPASVTVSLIFNSGLHVLLLTGAVFTRINRMAFFPPSREVRDHREVVL